MKRKLGEILLELGVINATQLQAGLEHQKRFQNKLKLGSSLVSLGFITEERLSQVLSRYLNIPMVDLNLEFITHDVLDLVPADVAERFQLIPFKIFEENRKRILGLAMSDPTNLEPIDIIQFSTSLNIRPYVATPTDVERSIQKYYHGILLDGISYVGQRASSPQPAGEVSGEKIKIISGGEEITWHGNLTREPKNSPSPNPTVVPASPEAQRVATSSTAQGVEQQEMMGEMLKLLKEQNALMKVLVKKGIISEEDIDQELKK